MNGRCANRELTYRSGSTNQPLQVCQRKIVSTEGFITMQLCQYCVPPHELIRFRNLICDALASAAAEGASTRTVPGREIRGHKVKDLRRIRCEFALGASVRSSSDRVGNLSPTVLREAKP